MKSVTTPGNPSATVVVAEDTTVSENSLPSTPSKTSSPPSQNPGCRTIIRSRRSSKSRGEPWKPGDSLLSSLPDERLPTVRPLSRRKLFVLACKQVRHCAELFYRERLQDPTAKTYYMQAIRYARLIGIEIELAIATTRYDPTDDRTPSHPCLPRKRETAGRKKRVDPYTNEPEVSSD